MSDFMTESDRQELIETVEEMKRTCGDADRPTLRDQIAMAALQGVLAPQSTETGEWIVGTEEFIAQRSYQIADAMLAERSK